LICINPVYNTPTRAQAGGSEQKVLTMDVSGRHYLTPLFEPGSVAVADAWQQRGLGRRLIETLIRLIHKGGLYG